MSKPALVVVGASLAGLRAVEAARRCGFDGTVTLVGEEPYLPYDRPPLSKDFLTGTTEAKYFRTEASLRDDLDVDLRLGAAARSLDIDKRVVVLGSEEINYTSLIIATGARARELPGVENMVGVHTLRSLDDGVALRKTLQPGTRVVIIGAGFIGSEVACSARQLGAHVTVVDRAPFPLTRAIGATMGAACASLYDRKGIELRSGVSVEGVSGNERVNAVRLFDGTALRADVVVVGVGATPNSEWLENSGLEFDNGVVCDATLNAGAPGVYAAGDIAVENALIPSRSSTSGGPNYMRARSRSDRCRDHAHARDDHRQEEKRMPFGRWVSSSAG